MDGPARYPAGAALERRDQEGGQGIRFLSALLVSYDPCVIYIAEGLLSAILVSRHDHARHPKEHDFGGSNKVVSGVVIVDFWVVGFGEAIENRNGPQPT